MQLNNEGRFGAHLLKIPLTKIERQRPRIGPQSPASSQLRADLDILPSHGMLRSSARIAD